MIERLEELQEFRGDWSALARAGGKPTSGPEWLERWWAARCPPADCDSRALRVVVVTEGGRLVALLPSFVVDRTTPLADLRLLGQPSFWSVGLLLRDDAPQDTVGLIARALSETSPPPARLLLWFSPPPAPWLVELQRQWPGGGGWLRRGRRSELLAIEGPLTAEQWFSSRASSLRTDLRRLRRRRSEAGLQLLLTEGPDEVRADVAALSRLHQLRLDNQSQWLVRGLEEVLVEAGKELISTGGFHLWKIVHEGEMVAGTLSVRVGDASEVLLTGFDPAWGRFGVGIASFVAGIEHDLDAGCRWIDLGPGRFQYLRLLSNTSRPCANYELFPNNRRSVRARVHWLPEHARERANILRVQLKLRRRLSDLRQRLQPSRTRR